MSETCDECGRSMALIESIPEDGYEVWVCTAPRCDGEIQKVSWP